jgi:hypothetical protein
MATLPTLTETLDNDFTHTWYEIRPNAIDNILDATVITLALKEYGSMVSQVGGRYITRTIRYGEKSTQNITKGTVLNQEEVELETLARWNWKYVAVDVNQSVIDSQKNSGPFKIKDYIATRLGAARDAMVQDNNASYMRSYKEDSSEKQHNGIYDIICPFSTTTNNLTDAHATTPDTYNSGATEGSGNINRSNSWWQNVYKATTPAADTNYALNLVPVMRTLWNKTTANLESPNFILMQRDLYEAYEDEVGDKQQIVRTAFDQKAADLGFETFTFKGATVSWDADLDHVTTAYKEIFMFNMNYVELVYDPNLWYQMGDWKSNSNQLERVAYIVGAQQLITTSPRRHGYVMFSS